MFWSVLIRSGSSLMVVGGVGLVILSSLGWWVVYFGC